MTTWVYIRSEATLFTVGFYDPTGKWHTDSDHDTRDAAAARVAYLNGRASLEEIETVARDVANAIVRPVRNGGSPYDLNAVSRLKRR
jgi:hypothetical protein